MKTQIYTLIAGLFIASGVQSQVLITPKGAANAKPHQSAVLELRDSNRGMLFPQVPVLNVNDNVTVPTPVNSLLVYNTTTSKLNFWESGSWNRAFDISDGLAIIKVTENNSGSSTGSITNSTFPTGMPLFNLDELPTNWINLGTSTTITITKASNTNYILAEGMVQINNDTGSNQEFQFGMGVFVDGKLKIASKYTAVGKNFVCNWRKFNLSGVFNDLSVGTHTVTIYGRNLPKITTGYTSLTYGGNSPNCSNINNDMAKIFVTAQTTQ